LKKFKNVNKMVEPDSIVYFYVNLSRVDEEKYLEEIFKLTVGFPFELHFVFDNELLWLEKNGLKPEEISNAKSKLCGKFKEGNPSNFLWIPEHKVEDCACVMHLVYHRNLSMNLEWLD